MQERVRLGSSPHGRCAHQRLELSAYNGEPALVEPPVVESASDHIEDVRNALR